MCTMYFRYLDFISTSLTFFMTSQNKPTHSTSVKEHQISLNPTKNKIAFTALWTNVNLQILVQPISEIKW